MNMGQEEQLAKQHSVRLSRKVCFRCTKEQAKKMLLNIQAAHDTYNWGLDRIRAGREEYKRLLDTEVDKKEAGKAIPEGQGFWWMEKDAG